MKKNKNPYPLGKIFEKITPVIGASVLMEPSGFVGQITFKNGRKSYFKWNTLDLNPLGSSNVAKDKDYASFFMKKLGYPIVPDSKTFFSKEWADIINIHNKGADEASLYAEEIGFPVIVKPNSGYWGIGVSLVYTKRELHQALLNVYKNDRIALVQKFVQGKDYRIVVLDKEVLSVYERTPLCVIGDGKSSIERLLKKKLDNLAKVGRGINLIDSDFSIKVKLKHQGLSLISILKKDEQIFLLDSANLSTGGDSFDVTEKVNKEFKKIAIQLTSDMGLRFGGVDLMVEGGIENKPDKYHVLEINSSPGLGHYSRHNKSDNKVLEDLYLKILKILEKTHK
jgi:D-alanine-D-alanine ligase-like ATP-grasp enzyme